MTSELAVEGRVDDHKLDTPPIAESDESRTPSKRLVKRTIVTTLNAMIVAGIVGGLKSQDPVGSPEWAAAITAGPLVINVFPLVTIAILAIFPSTRKRKLFALVYLGWSIYFLIQNLLQLLQILGGRHS
jgi:hypothetical protein